MWSHEICRDGESEENVDALTTLWRRLRAEAERAAASPVERLLDDVLLLWNAPMSSEERKRQVRGPVGARSGTQAIPHVGLKRRARCR